MEFHACLTARGDALFELADALLCGDAPVRSLAELSLVDYTGRTRPTWRVTLLGIGGSAT
ncbi:hypothetical protein GCM10009541_49720 [Micromonospora gifhornensis]|uniref:Uncharacterized protein n=1 Tax=Micromonospora gifhornensis TaxID=84594 RepID=A0ABQ4IKR1_9ACTN|nr:hypothetical protein Vgi01_51720 [Micromonospora gifhornensis]